ncbi:hypothetical protein Tsubulata_033762 [Turnera subulata]|uniref:Uncharacterized protein n=1 Tax=Turnera subulata TaxID=218843 RepID=A0A9Q0FTU1_9ROSI|nr:hypothetical protein Tsubulata_033762 [Turnera subulata]
MASVGITCPIIIPVRMTEEVYVDQFLLIVVDSLLDRLVRTSGYGKASHGTDAIAGSGKATLPPRVHSLDQLRFWLSNSIVLRAILSPVDKPELTISNGSSKEKNGGGKTNSAKSSPLRWKELSPGGKDTSGWNDPRAFVSALEKVLAWIFSRTIQSICCQVLP